MHSDTYRCFISMKVYTMDYRLKITSWPQPGFQLWLCSYKGGVKTILVLRQKGSGLRKLTLYPPNTTHTQPDQTRPNHSTRPDLQLVKQDRIGRPKCFKSRVLIKNSKKVFQPPQRQTPLGNFSMPNPLATPTRARWFQWNILKTSGSVCTIQYLSHLPIL